MKYKVGDKVRLKKTKAEFGVQMPLENGGKIGTIKSKNFGGYSFDEFGFYYTDDEIDCKIEESETVDENKLLQIEIDTLKEINQVLRDVIESKQKTIEFLHKFYRGR